MILREAVDQKSNLTSRLTNLTMSQHSSPSSSIRSRPRRALQPVALFIASITAASGLVATAPRSQAQATTRSGLDEAATGSWQKLVNQPPFQTDTAMLLTDGTVMVHQVQLEQLVAPHPG